MSLSKIKPNKQAEALVALSTHSFMGGELKPTLYDAQEQILCCTYVDYFNNRAIKADFSGDELDLRLFDRDAGNGAGERLLKDAGLLQCH